MQLLLKVVPIGELPVTVAQPCGTAKTGHKLLHIAALEHTRGWLHQSPPDFRLPTSWSTLQRLAVVCAARGLTHAVAFVEAIRAAIERLGLTRQHAKRWLECPNSAYTRKKERVID